MPMSVRITVSGSPPHMSVPMRSSPKTPPVISRKKTAKAAPHPQRRSRTPRRVQSEGTPETQSIATIAKVATAGRHCSS